MTRMIGALGLAGMLAVAGCGDDDDGARTGRISCTYAGDFCSELTGPLTSGQRSELAGSCTSSGGAFAAAGCSTAGTVPGYCAYPQGDLPAGLSGVDYYYTSSWTAASALEDCGFWGGTWAGGGTGGGNVAVSCNTTSAAICTDVSLPAASVSQFQTSCTGAGSTFAAGPCSTANLVGSCTVAGGAVQRFYSGLWTAVDAQTACADTGGTWAGATGGGGGGGTTVTVSCDMGGMCQELTGAFDAATLSGMATACGASFAQAACSRSGAVAGSCLYAASSSYAGGYGVPLREVYYTSSWTLAEAQSWCASPPAGTWQP